MSTTSLWIRRLLQRLQASGLVRGTLHGLVRLFNFVKQCYAWARSRQDMRPRGGEGGACQGRRLSGEASSARGEGPMSIIYTSKEPATLAASNYLEQARNSMFLSPEDSRPASRPASRPTSAHYQKESDEDDVYPISVQTASSSQPSRSGSRLSINSHQYQTQASVYGDHLAPSSRPSSRASVRVSNRLSAYITAEDSHRRRGRSKSRARSPGRTPASSRPRPGSVISIHGEKASLRSRSNAALPAGSPPQAVPPLPTNRPRRKQKMYPVVQTHRYDRGTKLQERPFEYTVEPMQMIYPLDNVPDDWEAHTHPEGILYFKHKKRRIYTEAWLCESEVLDEVEDFLAQLDEAVHESGYELPPDAELVLELENIPPGAEHNDLLTDKPASHYWTYYYVNHSARVLFWVQPHEISPELEQLRGFHSASHIKHGIESFYWKFFEFFPVGQTVSKELVSEVLSMLVYKNVDQLTSMASTVGMKPDDLQKLASMIKTAKGLGSNQYTACAIGRLMCLFAHDRYHYYYGQKVARLDRYQSLFDSGNRGKRTALAALLSPVLFNAPEVHLKSLERIWVDQIINEIPWSQFIQKLQTDWQEAVLTATVLLNANISFMTINDVDSGNGPRTPAQIASFVSTIASIAATVIGMLLVRQYRVKPKETATDAVTYLTSRRHPKLGLETLAIMYSLPYALLMWAVVTFLVAFALECFHIIDIPTISVTAATWGIAAMLLVLCLYTIWEGGDISVHQWFMDVWDGTQGWVREFYHRITGKHIGDLEAAPEQSSTTAAPGIAMEAC